MTGQRKGAKIVKNLKEKESLPRGRGEGVEMIEGRGGLSGVSFYWSSPVHRLSTFGTTSSNESATRSSRTPFNYPSKTARR